MSGWIKLHRRSLDNPLFKKPDIWHYWEYCLLKANHDPKKIIWNKNELVVDRGSFITGRKVAAVATGLTERKVRTALNTLVSLDMVSINTQKSTNKFTYLTVCNYDKYNNKILLPDQQATSKRPASDQQATTNKNVKNYKNEKKEDKPLPGAMDKVKEIFNLWNQYSVNGIEPLKVLTPGRIAKIKTRLKEQPDIGYWREVFSKLQKIPFFCGDNKTRWVITFKYVMDNDTNHVQIFERAIPPPKLSPTAQRLRDME